PGSAPPDMSAADHIRRVLTTFPGVFSGIGEFTIHKEFVSAKIAGETASLTNPALNRLLDFAAEVGLVALLHNDIDMPFPKPGQEPYQVIQLRDLFLLHPKTTIICAHAGLRRTVLSITHQANAGYEDARGLNQIEIPELLLSNPALAQVHIDLSWDETAKYIVANQETIAATADLINRHPDRFLFGTDEV